MGETTTTQRGQIPINRAATRRAARLPPPPRLRIYNPSWEIGFEPDRSVPRFKFWNPFTPQNLLAAACGPVLRAPLRNRVAYDANADNSALWRRRDLRVSRDGADCHTDAWNGANRNNATGMGRLRRDVWDDAPIHDYMDFGRKLVNAMWEEMNPLRLGRIDRWLNDAQLWQHEMPMLMEPLNYRTDNNAAWSHNTWRIGGDGEAEGQMSNIDLFGGIFPAWNTAFNTTKSEDDKNYKMTFKLPGVKEEDINVGIRNGVLTVTAQSNKEQRGDDEIQARYQQSFHHSLTLPQDALERNAKANLANDTLTVSIPKRDT